MQRIEEGIWVLEKDMVAKTQMVFAYYQMQFNRVFA
jgi:hypothetical protein